MLVFTAKLNGVYLGADLVLVAETRRKAYNDAKAWLKETHLDHKNLEFKPSDLQLLETSYRQTIVMCNGDYE